MRREENLLFESLNDVLHPFAQSGFTGSLLESHCWVLGLTREATEEPGGGGGGEAAVTKLKLAGCRNNETEESSRVILTHRAGVFNNTETPRSGGMRCWREEKQPDADTS